MKKNFIIYAPAINKKSAGAHSVLESFLSSLINETKGDHWQFVGHRDYQNLCENSNIQFYELDLNRKWIKRIFYDFYFFKKKYLTDENSQVIVVSMQNTTPRMRAIDISLTYLHQAIPFLEDFYPSIIKQPKLFLIKHFYFYFINHSICKERSFLIVQSEWLKEKIIEKMNIPAGHIFIHRPLPLDITPSDFIKNKNESFFYPAIYQVYKNHLNLIKGFCLAANENSSREYLLELTLDQSIFKELMDYAGIIPTNLHIKNCGVLTRIETLKKINNAKAVIFPSLVESYGMPIAEALYFKTPVLASNIPYAKELLGDEGILFDPLDVESIKNSILNFQPNIRYSNLSAERFQSWSDILKKFSKHIILP